jgi:shikimate dehydrogenase
MDLDRLPGRRLDEFLSAARIAGFAGVNITYPCKETALALVDAVSPEARQIGAINTVTFDRDGRATGHNTDRIGFLRSFEDTLGRVAVEGRTVLLIGAGGAGRSVGFALLDLGAECVLVHDKDGARADVLVASLVTQFKRSCSRAAPDIVAALSRVAGVVNATPVGMIGIPGNPIPMDRIGPHHWVADVIYTPLETELIRAAREKGARVLGGAGMCVHQAAEAFRLFTRLAPDVARMRRTFIIAARARDRTVATPREAQPAPTRSEP